MHWMEKDSDNGFSIEFQHTLSYLFSNINFSLNSFISKNKKSMNLINEKCDYQALLIEKSSYKNDKTSKKDKSNIDIKESDANQTNFSINGSIIDKNGECDNMGEYESENEKNSDFIDIGNNILSLKPLDQPKILISPDNNISLVHRICPYCNSGGGHYNDVYDKQIRNKEGIKEKYQVTLYKCTKCEKKYGPFTYKQINKTIKEKINLDERIRECYAKTGLSYDKVAEMVGTFCDISISHQYVKEIIETPIEEFQETREIVILPNDYKINGKTSKERKVTDIATIYMFKRKDIDYSGEVTADEVFLKMMKKRQYLVSIMDNNISDMPIAIAIIPTRIFEVMKAVFDFVFENDPLKTLTTDMFKVYSKIADEYNSLHQECNFHSMLYVGKIIYKELKIKDKYDVHEKIWIKSLLTEYREILRQFNYGDAVEKMENFLRKMNLLPDFFESIAKHLRKHFPKLFTHLQFDGVLRTSNKCETFNSLPQIRRIKNTSKNPWGLLHRLACTVKYYLPNRRTLQNRGDWHILPAEITIP